MLPTKAQHKVIVIILYPLYSMPLGNFGKTSAMTTRDLMQKNDLYKLLIKNRNTKLLTDANSSQIITFY